MGELNRTYSQLLAGVEAGEPISVKVRWLSHLNGPVAIENALKNHDIPVKFRLFEPGEDSFGKYVNRPFLVHDVEEFDDQRVFYVTAADRPPVGTVEFMIEHYNQSNMPNEVSLLSFCVQVESVSDLT